MIDVRIEKDSIAPSGIRLTTFVIKYPRFVHCFDEETEVLSEVSGKRRFRKWRDVVNTDAKIAAYNENGTIEFETPKQWIKNYIEEDLIKIESQRISMLVTDKHRLYVGSRKSKHDKWEVITADHMLTKHTQKRFKTYGILKGGKNIGKLAKLIGFFIGDGTIAGKQMIFHLKKQRKINYLISLLNELNIKHGYVKYKDDTVNIKFRDYLTLFQDCYDVNRKKQIPEILFNTDRESFMYFLEGLFYSDGSTNTGYLKVFNTTSHSVADGLNTLASMYGERINLIKSYDGKYKLTRSTENKPIIRCDKHPAKKETYKGNVYCATVSTGLLVVRRKGLVHISGNCELMTHRVFSRNASSSRAIPFKKQCEYLKQDIAYPIEFRKNKSGMQAGEPLDDETQFKARFFWQQACDNAIKSAEMINKLDPSGVHKQYINRLLEPFSHITVIVTSTDFQNFFGLRYHNMAQPEIEELAKQMYEAYQESTPRSLEAGQWHLPFVDPLDSRLSHIQKIQKSVACCARVSYNNHDGSTPTLEQNKKLYDRLLGAQPIHASPAEHQAMATGDAGIRSGNFKGWVQYRQTLAGQNIDEFKKG